MSDSAFNGLLIAGVLSLALLLWFIISFMNIKRIMKNADHGIFIDPLADAKRKIDIIIDDSSSSIEALYETVKKEIFSNREALYYSDLFEASEICASIIENIENDNIRKDYLVRVFRNMKSQAEFEETLKALGIGVDIYRFHIANIYLKKDA